MYEKHLPLLRTRSTWETALVRCSLEAFLAVEQGYLPPAERMERFEAPGVCDRAHTWLAALPARERLALIRILGTTLTELAERSAKTKGEEGNAAAVCKFLLRRLRYDRTGWALRPAAESLLPRWLYAKLMGACRRLARIGNGQACGETAS